MSDQKQLSQIFEQIRTHGEESLSSLLEKRSQLVASEPASLLAREELFSSFSGKVVCVPLLQGDAKEKAGVAVMSATAAIKAGGNLLKMSDDDLQMCLGEEALTADLEDAVVKIVDALAAVATKDCAALGDISFASGELNNLVAEEAAAGDGLIAEGSYFGSKFELSCDDEPAGPLLFALSAAALDLATGGATAKDYDPEKNKALLGELLSGIAKQLGEEVGGLLGRGISFELLENSFVDDKTFFQTGSGKKVMAEIDFGSGEKKLGRGYCAVSTKDAIRLGGILVMLPDSELDKSIDEEDFYEDLQDAYGEVANIISGVFTQVMEAKYVPAKTRVIRKNLFEVNPEESEGIIDQQIYYCVDMAMKLADVQLDAFTVLFPALALKLSKEDQQLTENEEQKVQEETAETPQKEAQTAGETKTPQKIDFPLGEELDSIEEKVNSVLAQCLDRCQKEISALTGATITLGNISNQAVSKEDFFEGAISGSQILTKMVTNGDKIEETESFLFCELQDAIRLGGILVMLPPPELEKAVEEMEFNEDVKDAFGEIANIVAGAYTSAFDELHDKHLHFIRRDFEAFDLAEEKSAASKLVPDGNYYRSSMDLVINGTAVGAFNFLVPLDILELQGLLYDPAVAEEESAQVGSAKTSAAAQAGGGGKAGRSAGGAAFGVLVVGDDSKTIQVLTKVFEEKALIPKILSFKDEIMDHINADIKAVYLVMEEINEQGFGVLIKIHAKNDVPMVMAAPGWTRSSVIKALKYGVKDILLTPATAEDMVENIEKNIAA